MVVGTRVNTQRVYYNFDGQLPPVTLEPDPVTPPSMQDDLPKLITDTTLRDGAQDSRFAIFPPDVRLQYYDLLHQLDNDTGSVYGVEAFIYQKRDVWTLEPDEAERKRVIDSHIEIFSAMKRPRGGRL